MIKRRLFLGEFVISAGACALAGPFGAAAQPAPKLPRVALVFNAVPLADMAGPDPVNVETRSFLRGLRDLGYVEGSNIVIERRSAHGRPERMAGLMQEIIALRVDVIVTVGRGAQDAQRSTDSIPIVALVDAPESLGLSASLGRPSLNLTGVTQAADLAIHAKRLQLLKETAPKAVRVAAIDFGYINSRETPGTHIRRGVIEAAARKPVSRRMSFDISCKDFNAQQP